MATTKRKKKPFTRQGDTVSLDSDPRYPKEYRILIERHPGDPTMIRTTRTVGNMTGWELYGLLHITMKEIERQLLYRNDQAISEGEE